MTDLEQNSPIHITELKPDEPWRLLSLRASEQDTQIRAGFEAIEKLKGPQKFPPDLSAIDVRATLGAFDAQIAELEALAKTLQDAEEKRAKKTKNEKRTSDGAQDTAESSDKQGNATAGSTVGESTNSGGENEQSNNQREKTSNLELQLAEKELEAAESDLDRKNIIHRRVCRDRDGYFYGRLRNSAPMYDVDAPPPLTAEDRIESAADVVAEVYKRHGDNLETNKTTVMDVFHLSAVTVDLLIRHKQIFSEDTTQKIKDAQERAVATIQEQMEEEQQAWEQDMGLRPASEAEEDEDIDQAPDIPEEAVVALLKTIREDRARYVQEATASLGYVHDRCNKVSALSVSDSQVREHTGFTGDNFFEYTDYIVYASGFALFEARRDLEQAEKALEDLKLRQERFSVGRIEELVRQYGRESTLLGKLALKADTIRGASMLRLGEGFENARKQAIADMVVILEKEEDIEEWMESDEKNQKAEGALRDPHDLIAKAKQLGDEDTGRRSQHAREIQDLRELIKHLEACKTWESELIQARRDCDYILALIQALDKSPSSSEGDEGASGGQSSASLTEASGQQSTEVLSAEKKQILRVQMEVLFREAIKPGPPFIPPPPEDTADEVLLTPEEQEIPIATRVAYLREVLAIAEQLDDNDYKSDAECQILLYEAKELEILVASRVKQCIADYKSSGDLDAFLSSAVALTDDIKRLSEMEHKYHILSKSTIFFSSATSLADDLYQTNVLFPLYRANRYVDAIRVAQTELNILNDLSTRDDNLGSRLLLLAYITDGYRFSQQYDLAIATMKQIMRLSEESYHSRYDPSEDEKLLKDLMNESAKQNATSDAKTEPTDRARPDASRPLTSDIPESIPVDQELLGRVLDLPENGNTPEAVAQVLSISPADLAKQYADFKEVLGGAQADGTPNTYTRAQVLMLARAQAMLSHSGEESEDLESKIPKIKTALANMPQGALTPDTTMPSWVYERINRATKQLGLSDDSKVKEVFIALTELGWIGTETEERVIQKIRDFANESHIPIVADAVAGFCEYLLGVLDTRHGDTIENRLDLLKPHLNKWIEHNLSAIADLLPFLKGGKVAMAVTTLLQTLGNDDEESSDSATPQWNVLTQDVIQSVLSELVGRTSDDTSAGGKLAHATAEILSHLLKLDNSFMAQEIQDIANNSAVQQGLRRLAQGLKE